jgi:carbon-monoxide dehydrogenase large subunit
MALERFSGRREDDRLLTGQGCYTADWNLPGQLHGCFLRSDRAHAEIVSLNLERALAMPGIVEILTNQQTKNLKTPPPWVKLTGKGGSELKVPHREVLAGARVRFVGQTIALVVAESAHAAQDAAELIEIEYRDLQAVAEARPRCRRARRSFTTRSRATSRSNSNTATRRPRRRPSRRRRT